MKHRRLGPDGPSVSAIGLGCSVLSPGMYGPISEDEGIRLIRHALDAGINLIDTADAYGADGHNETVVGKAIKGRRDEAVLATKFGMVPQPGHESRPVGSHIKDVELRVNGRPEHVRSYAEASLRRLATDVIDIYLLHFPDPVTPIEETVSAMADLVKDGKVRYLGLCNASSSEVRRAHATHPLTVVQNNYSLWSREPEAELLPTTRKLGIGFVPWQPLGAGFLTGTVTGLQHDDFRNRAERFQPEAFAANRDRFSPLFELAAEREITPAQLALAWLLHQDEHIVPIPGTRDPGHLTENAAAADVRLTPADLLRINELCPPGLAIGAAII